MGKKIIAVITMWLLVFPLFVYAKESPVPMLQTAADGLLDSLKQNKSKLRQNPQIIRTAVAAHLVPHVDVYGMARSVAGKDAWSRASESEREAFANAFRDLVIRTYAAPLAEYSGETIKFMPVKGNLEERFVRVNSEIKRPSGQRIPLSYSLVSKNEKWKVYDFSIEGVSLLQSFRQQFAGALKNSNIRDVTEQMRHKKVG